MSNHIGNANKMVSKNHLPDTSKMVSDTPRTDAEMVEMTTGDGPVKTRTKWVHSSVCIQLERELNRACEMYRKLDIHALNLVDRIMRLEAAGDRMEKLMPDGSICDKAANAWREAKEAKP